MNKNKIVSNYIYNLIYQILIILIPFITIPYLSRVLGAENIGIYSYTLSITTYFILFGSLGISMYGQREIAYLQNKSVERSKAFFEIFFLRFITLAISMILFYFFFCYNGVYNLYYKIFIIEIIANIIDISWFFQGLEEFKKTVIRNIIVKITSVIFIFLFVKSPNDLWIYILIYVLSTLFGNFSLWLYLPKYIVFIPIKKLNLLKHIKPTIALFIPQIAVQIYTVLDKTMIGTIVSNKVEVGYYEQAQKTIKLLLTIATSLGTVMAPRMANLFSNGDNKKIKIYMKNSLSFIMFLALPLMFGIISISDNFVPIFYGPGFEKVSILIKIISPIIVLIGISNVIGTQYLLPTKQQNKYTISVIIGAVVNFILNILLISRWLSLGAAIATVIAEFLVTLTQLYLVRNMIKIKDIINISYKYIISSIVMFIVNLIINMFLFTQSNLIGIIIQVLLSIFVYVLLLFILKDKLIKMVINFIKTRKKEI